MMVPCRDYSLLDQISASKPCKEVYLQYFIDENFVAENVFGIVDVLDIPCIQIVSRPADSREQFEWDLMK